ncbi:MAG: DUF4242 domain-containing protein [Saprospiraceae bacterium]|jgi:hypothetical protein|nr:DUF4242 domain-containing protein [Ulvibacter sp.]|tara:strand:+ start:300 stop:584 length:285 start_codon:yes stop_codon:yes gene_type:complete
MNKYFIKREIPNAFEIPSQKLDEIGKGSESVLIEMRNEGKKIEQEVSYVAGNNVFCIYNADSEDTIKEHANRAGVPVNEITLVPNVLKHNTNNN